MRGLHLEVIDGGPNNGRKWWDNINLGGSDKANALNFGKLLGLGCDEEMIKKLDGDMSAIATWLVDREAKATVQHRSWTGSDGIERHGQNTYFSRDKDSVDPAARASADGPATEAATPAASADADAGEETGRGW